jgi:hypothetical protein
MGNQTKEGWQTASTEMRYIKGHSQQEEASKTKAAVMDPGLALMCRREERSRKTGNIPKMFMEEYEHTQIRTLFVSSEHKKNLWR